MNVKDRPNKVSATLKVIVTGEFYDDDTTEETLRFSVEQDLEDAGFDVDVSLLKEQEPRVLTLDELRALYDTVHFVWVEDNGEDDCFDGYAEVNISYKGEVQLYSFGFEVPYEPDNEMYGETWRCWSAKPTVKQRGAVPWER